jgi:hypothetical protein
MKKEQLLKIGSPGLPLPLAEQAKRDPVGYRYDILDVEFLELMAKIAAYGAKKYGDLNWHKSRLDGEKGPMNHLMNHYKMYMNMEPYDHGEVTDSPACHLAAIAFNAMMEFYYVKLKAEVTSDE